MLATSAQAVLGNLPGDSKRNFNDLCKALEDRFAPANQTDLYRAQLKERRQRAVETIPELGQDIRRLTNLAYATAPVDVRETLAKEQFIDALVSSDMRLRIKQSRPQDLNHAVCLAVELDAFNNAEKRMQEKSGFVRSAEVEPKHENPTTDKMLAEMNKMLNDLRMEVQSMKNGQGQSSTQYMGPKERTGRGPTCYFCGKEGHIKKNVRNFLKVGSQNKMTAKDRDIGMILGTRQTRKKFVNCM